MLTSTDHWRTPSWCTEALLQHHPPETDWVLEPSAGAGSVVNVLLRYGYLVTAVEIEEQHRDSLLDYSCRSSLNQVIIADFLGLHADYYPPADKPYAIVANPPWSPGHSMTAHINHCLNSSAEYIALLLPLFVLSGGSGRKALWESHRPPDALYWFDQRPKFIGDGGRHECAWFVWDQFSKRDQFQEMRMLRWDDD